VKLVEELCCVHDRLIEVRAELDKDGLILNGRRHPLLATEVQLSTQYRLLWQAAGFGDREDTQVDRSELARRAADARWGNR
jgi:hypothetical protein